MEQVKLSKLRVLDLLQLVNNMKPADLPKFETVRQVSKIADKLEESIKTFMDERNDVASEARKSIEKDKAALDELVAKNDKKNEKAIKALEDKMNKDLEPFNEKLRKQEEKALEEIELEFDKVQLDALKDIVKEGMDKFNSIAIYNSLCDSLGL